MQKGDYGKRQSIAIYFVWFIAAFFFCFQYMLRVIPNIVADSIFSEFHLTADQFSTLGSLYFLSYSLLQIPLGKVTDIYGIGKVVLYSLILCICSNILFYFTGGNFVILQISRVITGIGSAGALLCALKVVTDHLPKKYRNLLMGLTLSMGTVSALISGKVVSTILKYVVWQKIGLIFALFGVLLLIAFIISIKYANFTHSKQPLEYNISLTTIVKQLFEILKNPSIFTYALLSIGFFTPLATLADLWGSVFLKQKFTLNFNVAAHASLNLYLGLSIGSIFLPIIAEKSSILNKMIIFCIIMVCILFGLLIYGPYMHPLLLQILLCTIGFFCGCEMLCFSAASHFAKQNHSGKVIGVVNTFNMMGCAILQQIVGFILDIRQGANHSTMNNANVHYSIIDFQYALSPVFITILVCILGAILVLYNTKNFEHRT